MIKFSLLIQFSGESFYLQSTSDLTFLVLFLECNLIFSISLFISFPPHELYYQPLYPKGHHMLLHASPLGTCLWTLSFVIVIYVFNTSRVPCQAEGLQKVQTECQDFHRCANCGLAHGASKGCCGQGHPQAWNSQNHSSSPASSPLQLTPVH